MQVTERWVGGGITKAATVGVLGDGAANARNVWGLFKKIEWTGGKDEEKREKEE